MGSTLTLRLATDKTRPRSSLLEVDDVVLLVRLCRTADSVAWLSEVADEAIVEDDAGDEE